MKKIAVLTVGGIALVATIQVLAATHYFQGFETDTYDWSGVTRVASGTNGVPSAAGDFHAEAAAAPGTSALLPALEAMSRRSRPAGIRRALTCTSTSGQATRTTRASIGHPRSTIRPAPTAATSSLTPGSTTTLTPPGPVLAS